MDDRTIIAQQNISCVENPSPTSFLSLSREIRDAIYELVLVAPDPIFVWCGKPLSCIHDQNGKMRVIRRYGQLHVFQDELDTTQDIKAIASKMLRCHPLISHEAAKIYYRQNIFQFAGDFRWSTVVNWLTAIGSRNRSCLSGLIMSLCHPQLVYQLPNGARTKIDENVDESVRDLISNENKKEPVYPRSRFLYLAQDTGFKDADPDPNIEGLVENINPQVETVFSLLGSIVDGPKITMSILTAFNQTDCYPPEEHLCSMPFGSYHWLRTDLPNVMEKCREIYFPKNDREIELVWKGEVCGVFIKVYAQALRENGWQIISINEAYPKIYELGCCLHGGDNRVFIEMKRENIEGLVVPDEPVYGLYLHDGVVPMI